MSLFTQRITEMIFESGETVQTLAETGKINRSTLQRVKSGERLPSQPVFQGLCKALRLSAAEGEELKILLEVEFSNEDPTLRLILHYQRGDETIFKHLAIHEANIIQAFDDFFNSLPSSDYVLSKAETIAGIEAIIRDYGSSLAPDML